MRPLRDLFSSSGRLRPPAFILGAVAVYVAGLASQWLTVPDVLAKGGLWPFIVVQAALIWIWFTLHAKRLRDSGHTIGLAVAASLLYALSVLLLMIVADAFFNTATLTTTDANTTGALGLLLSASIIAALLGSPHYDLAWMMVAVMTAMAFVPIFVVLAVTLWAATRPSADGQVR